MPEAQIPKLARLGSRAAGLWQHLLHLNDSVLQASLEPAAPLETVELKRLHALAAVATFLPKTAVSHPVWQAFLSGLSPRYVAPGPRDMSRLISQLTPEQALRDKLADGRWALMSDAASDRSRSMVSVLAQNLEGELYMVHTVSAADETQARD